MSDDKVALLADNKLLRKRVAELEARQSQECQLREALRRLLNSAACVSTFLDAVCANLAMEETRKRDTHTIILSGTELRELILLVDKVGEKTEE